MRGLGLPFFSTGFEFCAFNFLHKRTATTTTVSTSTSSAKQMITEYSITPGITIEYNEWLIQYKMPYQYYYLSLQACQNQL